MPFPLVEPGFETLFEPTRILLFGKPFPSIAYVPGSMTGVAPAQNVQGDPLVPGAQNANEFADFSVLVPPHQNAADVIHQSVVLGMPPRRLERMLRRPGRIFARIYSFSFEGHYYNLPRPLLFLVGGPGRRPEEDPVGQGMNPNANARKVGYFTKFTGVEARDWHFSDDILVWAVDKKDLAVCVDIEVESYEQVLLDSMIAVEEEMASRGAAVSRGAAASRGAAVSRGAAASRGAVSSRGAASFRGAMVGPHQEL